jgi:hypothetical protein
LTLQKTVLNSGIAALCLIVPLLMADLGGLPFLETMITYYFCLPGTYGIPVFSAYCLRLSCYPRVTRFTHRLPIVPNPDLSLPGPALPYPGLPFVSRRWGYLAR